MSIHVTDFKWEKGKNDLEYIALLEKNIDVMANKFRECSKVAREQYKQGKADGARQFVGWLDEQNIVVIPEKDYGEYEPNTLCFADLLAEYEKEQK